jgi:uncharacterized repeat protein (TIGR03803 family)
MPAKNPPAIARVIFAIFGSVLIASVATPTPAQAQTFKVLHTFDGTDGQNPIGQLILDSAGNIYGTTGEGGSSECGDIGCGTAFKMGKGGKLLWLHSFKGANGETPSGGLLRDASGNFYGTTENGGRVNNHICSFGCGVVFKLNAAGAETVLYRFTGTPDGYFPVGPLVEDTAGNLYGAAFGGADGSGAVFKIDKTGKETLLYSFSCGSDGCDPSAGVILDTAGNLYGVTLDGGSGFGNSGYGVVYRVDTAGNETVLHTFSGPDGANPSSVLLLDSDGNLYGTTQNGGSSTVCGGGCGTVFELSPQGESWSETVLYSFCSLLTCDDGEVPGHGPLVRDTAGNLYGTTEFGGTFRNCNREACGVVFKLDATGPETVLHNFTGGSDGQGPWGGLTFDSADNLYGAVLIGGDLSCSSGGGQGCGTVFKIAP